MNSPFTSRLVYTLVGVAAACGLPDADSKGRPAAYDVTPAIVDRLTEKFGCDETFVARNPESTVVLAVQVPGILERSSGADLPYSEKIQAGGPGIVVRLEQGADLDHWCTDIMARPPQIDVAWVGVSGTATVVLVERRARKPSGASANRPVPTEATVRLGSTVLAREDNRDERRTIPGLEIEVTLGEPGGG